MSAIVFGSPEARIIAQNTRSADEAMVILRRYDQYNEEIGELRFDLDDIRDTARRAGRPVAFTEREEIRMIKEQIEACNLEMRACKHRLSALGWTFEAAEDHQQYLKSIGCWDEGEATS